MTDTIKRIQKYVEAESESLAMRMEYNRKRYDRLIGIKDEVMRTLDFGNPNIIANAVEMNALKLEYSQMKQEDNFLRRLAKIIDESENGTEN